MRKYFMLFAFIALVAFGCSQRPVTKPGTQTPPDQQKAEQQKTEKADTSQQPQKPAENIVEKNIASNVESVESAKKDGRDAMTGEVKEGLFSDIHFDFDKYDVRDEDKAVLKSVSSYMIKNGAAKLMIEGHCDERGTNEYNLALGDRRAKAVKDYIVSLGVSSSRMDTISYGEEKPLCPDQTEECWAKNRRAHFVFLGKAGK